MTATECVLFCFWTVRTENYFEVWRCTNLQHDIQ